MDLGLRQFLFELPWMIPVSAKFINGPLGNG
jgi:hypothetical protein